MKEVHINVTVSDATPSRLKSVTASLARQGVKVESTLAAIGIITGKVSSRLITSLDGGPGVTIELDGQIQLPPPNAPVQ